MSKEIKGINRIKRMEPMFNMCGYYTAWLEVYWYFSTQSIVHNVKDNTSINITAEIHQGNYRYPSPGKRTNKSNRCTSQHFNFKFKWSILTAHLWYIFKMYIFNSNLKNQINCKSVIFSLRWGDSTSFTV